MKEQLDQGANPNKENVSKSSNRGDNADLHIADDFQPDDEVIDSKRSLKESRKKAVILRHFKKTDSSDLLDY